MPLESITARQDKFDINLVLSIYNSTANNTKTIGEVKRLTNQIINRYIMLIPQWLCMLMHIAYDQYPDLLGGVTNSDLLHIIRDAALVEFNKTAPEL